MKSTFVRLLYQTSCGLRPNIISGYSCLIVMAAMSQSYQERRFAPGAGPSTYCMAEYRPIGRPNNMGPTGNE